jgi:STE24 endopeptidase
MRVMAAIRRRTGRRGAGQPGGSTQVSWARVGAATVAAIAVAEVAVWLLRPREVPPPAALAEREYFSSDQIERAESYRSGQRTLLLGTLAVEGGVLALLASGRPAAARRALAWAGRRPLRGAAMAGAGLSAGIAVLTLPLGAVAHQRAVDAGLSTQGFPAWLADAGRTGAIGAVFAAGGAAILVGLTRRYRARWWIPAAGAAIGLEVLFVWLAPVVLAPLFNRFEPLPPSETRAEVLSLARKAGVDVRQVYRVDASRRTRTLNAYVDGIGSSRRVVLYDNLLNEANRPALRAVVAHELGHVANRDVLRGMAFFALLAPAGLLLAGLLAQRLLARSGVAPGTPAALPAYALAIAVTAMVLGVPGNQLSRGIEARADSFALELTRDPDGLIELQRSLAVANLADPSPPRLLHLLLGTHPTTMERIGAAVAFERARIPLPR